MDNLSTLRSWIAESKNIVFFGGAGVSTESGIPDFRSVDGLYHQKFDYPPETILSHSFFYSNTEDLYKFYREKMLVTDIEPNRAHKALAKLEQQGKLSAVITQNIDGLHQKASSKTVYELHGSVHRNYCRRCANFYSGEDLQKTTGVPRCTCGGRVKPDVVLYEEGLDQQTIENSIRAIREADLLIIGGTSLNVWPAAGLINYYRGDRVVLINKSAVGRDLAASLVITDPIGEVLSQL